MHLCYIFIFFITTLINTYGHPVQQEISVYESMNSIIDIKKCTYLRKTKLFEPEPEFLLKCSNSTLGKSIKKLDETYLNDALCLLYYNSFEQLCNVTSHIPSASLETILTDEVIYETLSTYQGSAKPVCDVLQKNKYFLKDAKPGIDTIYKYINNGECKRFCTDFEEKVNPACAFTAFIIEHIMVLDSLLNSRAASVGIPKQEASQNKPSLTEHGHRIDNHLEASTEDKHVNSSNLPDNKTTSNTTSLINNAKPAAMQIPTDINQVFEQTQQQSQAVEASVTDEKLSSNNGAVLKVQAATSVADTSKNLLSISQQAPSSSTSLPSVGMPNDNSNADLQLQEEGNVEDKPEEEDNNHAETAIGKNKIENTSNKQIPPNVFETEQEGAIKDVREGGEIKNDDKQSTVAKKDNQNSKTKLGSKESVLSIPILETSSNTNLKKEENMKEKLENNKLTTKNDGNMDMPPFENEPDDSLMIDKEGIEREQEDYDDDADPKFSEVKVEYPKDKVKPETVEESPNFPANYQNQNIDDSDSYFFSYFMMVCIMFICAYVAYHNKQKILALVVEGRKGRRPSRTRRPNSANYRKLDSNLEEAVTSSCNKNATHVIY